MSRPAIKADLLAQGEATYQKLGEVLASLPDPEQTFSFTVTDKMKEAHWRRDKNARDVLIHLYEWQQLLLKWVTSHQAGDTQPFLPAPYNWRTYGQMNQAIWEKHQATSFAQAQALLAQSHADVIALAERLSNDELFTKAYFDWTGNSSLGAYFVSTLSSHYDWALKKLRRQLKAG